jgi:hypothetical protein
MPVAAIGTAIGGLGSLVSTVNQKNVAKANENAESSIDNELTKIYGTMLKDYNSISGETNPGGALAKAESVYGSEATGGLSPETIAAANNNLGQQQKQGLASIINSLGPSTPNLAGVIKQYGQQELQSDVSENIGLAGENQGVQQQGAAGLAGIAGDVLNFGQSVLGGASGGLAGLGKQFNAASATPQTNPLTSFGSLIAALPNLFSSGNTTGSTGITPPGGLGMSFDPSQFLNWLQPQTDTNSGSLGIPAGGGGGTSMANAAPAS